jgi:hypothetical protein
VALLMVLVFMLQSFFRLQSGGMLFCERIGLHFIVLRKESSLKTSGNLYVQLLCDIHCCSLKFCSISILVQLYNTYITSCKFCRCMKIAMETGDLVKITGTSELNKCSVINGTKGYYVLAFVYLCETCVKWDGR